MHKTEKKILSPQLFSVIVDVLFRIHAPATDLICMWESRAKNEVIK